MVVLRLALVTAFGFCFVQAVLVGQEKRQGFDSYGPPPRPAPQYGPPPPQHVPHREYGVPQQIPFQEYGPPALKYGPPKLNYIGGGNGPKNGVYEQIKAHFGVPKPFYGPPHVQHKPKPEYGPPPQQHYGPPPQHPIHYQQLPKPSPQYGPPPQKIQHRPAPQYGPPPQKQQFFIPPGPPQPLPAPHPAPLFKPAHQPATSYGPPASGPLNLPPKPVYEPPSNYGPPPLPINLPGPHVENFNRVPETTIIVSGPGGQHPPSGPGGYPQKQVQIQIDASGHTHSVSGSQAPFHTACDGWKPIAAPVGGAYVEHNHVETQGGYSNVNQGQTVVTQYNVGGSSGGSIVDGLTDEQLVAVALQGEGGSTITGPSGGGHADSDALQIAVNAIDDSYLKPPADSYAPGSVHDIKYQTIGNNAGPGGPPPQAPVPTYGVPPPPAPQTAALTSSFVQQSQSHSQQHSNVNIQYGPPAGNGPIGGGPPVSPVIFRPPVPAGLIESIGATVQHLDEFGVKPPQQTPNYIPPAAHEIALGGAPPVPSTIYGAAPNHQAPPQFVGQQLLPHPQQGPSFAQGPAGPPRPPQGHYIPPLPQQGPPPPPPQQQQQQHHFLGDRPPVQGQPPFIYSQGLPLAQQPRFNQQPILQGGPNPHQQPQTIVVHDCGHGPNLVSSTGYQVQHHQHQQQQFGSISASSSGAYNAIAQSVPVAEQHTQFLTGPADSYGPPPSGNDIDFDHSGYASQKNAVAALPDGTDPQQLPGLDGLNVISAQKSQSIHFDSNSAQPKQNFQIQYGSSLNNAGGNQGNPDDAADQSANHEEILSQGLLQSILTAIEQPHTTSALPQNHRAESRSDNHNDENEDELEKQQPEASERVEVRVSPEKAEGDADQGKKSIELEPIVAEEESDDKH